ncbi:peptidoglycan-binding domain 1 protein [Bifidobacterium eulemuris]|uniref:Peptidoglycan-binding domain 1 protein n=1 Tax=Bifidobacterium eulemuris TaxID=1765219 RepID=A0A261GBT7_9BIFI|nr:peptidoglycan-binding domain 1 protein [Bifidobacterium eulemuris]QOL31564.1 hypothetical protein BE0216_03120 [Bifidobacterium eulemuris]
MVRRKVSIVWLPLSVMTAMALTAGACALWLPDRAPALLDSAKEITSVPVNTQQYSGQQQVTVVPTMSASYGLIGNASGTVTANWSGAGLNSGAAAYKVNDRVIIALNTASPLYRDLTVGDQGDDVRALNDELGRLGYASASGTDLYDWRTRAGWQQLMSDSGNTSDGSLHLSDVLWIPQSSVRTESWSAGVGVVVNASDIVGEVPGGITSLTIKNGQALDRSRVLTVFDQTTVLPAGETTVSDAAFCQQVALTEGFRTMTADMLSAGFDATLAFEEPVTVLRVPAGAVYGITGSTGCVVADGEETPVLIVGAELGVSLVRPSDDTDTSAISEVALGSRLSQLTCG